MVPNLRSTARLRAVLPLVCALAACRGATTTTAAPAPAPARGPVPLQTPPPVGSLGAHPVVPLPTTVVPAAGAPFTIDSTTRVVVAVPGPEAGRTGEMLAALLRPSTGFRIPLTGSDGPVPRGSIVLRLGGAAELGAEGYDLTISADSVRIVAAAPAGLFYGVQTLRQLLPAGIEAEQSPIKMASAWTAPAGRITDRPRFGWRGMMLDVSRHFFTVDEVKQVIDLLALYKLNTLHLHLADDQGWRIQIDSWPKLTTVGGATEVGGGPGGYYTKADYADIVRYAQDRFITIVPEIDMPAHTHAAIVAYPELGCGRLPRDSATSILPTGHYVGITVGFSALCPDKDVTWRFVDDVFRELAAMTPGPYLHMGGDEVEVLNQTQYNAFVERTQDIIAKYGKTMVGWDEIGHARLRPGTIAQMWRPDTVLAAVKAGGKLLMSPATKIYIDMKYTPATELGHRWAAITELRDAYDWNPATHFPGVQEQSVVGVEAPLWSETVHNVTSAMFLIVPRLPAIAEVGWSPQSARSWDGFRTRIAAHAPRWRLLGINFYPSPQVDWEPRPTLTP